MSIKKKIANAIAPQIVRSVTEHFDEILNECLVCKNNDEEAIKSCDYWQRKKLYRCERVADILEKVKGDVAIDTVMPVVNAVDKASNTVSAKITSAKDRIKNAFTKKKE
jgi:predicted Zn-dependent protease